MYMIRFSTLQPYHPLLRALDTLRKMGFKLLVMNVAQSGLLYVTELQFEVSGSLAAHTFVERLRLADIVDLAVEEFDEGMPAGDDLVPAALRSAAWTFQ